MITRRDIGIAAAAFVAAIVISRAAQPDLAVMSSTVFDWNTIAVRTNATGSVRQFLRAPTATLDELELHVTTLLPGASPHLPHQHPDEELIIIREGTVESLVNGQLKRVGPGSVIFQAANQLHSIRNIGETPAVYHVIKWNSPGMLKARAARTQ